MMEMLQKQSVFLELESLEFGNLNPKSTDKMPVILNVNLGEWVDKPEALADSESLREPP